MVIKCCASFGRVFVGFIASLFGNQQKTHLNMLLLCLASIGIF